MLYLHSFMTTHNYERDNGDDSYIDQYNSHQNRTRAFDNLQIGLSCNSISDMPMHCTLKF